MKKFNCVIVDDEPLAIEVIKNHISKLDAFEIIGTFKNALEANNFIKSNVIDLLFLDIQMPGLKGTDFLRNIDNPPKTILTTAYREYALEGYELDVVDYLLKPVSFERFFKATSKFIQYKSQIKERPIFDSVDSRGPDYIYMNVNKKIHKIILADITYVESIKDYISINTIHEKIIAKHTLSSFQELLPEAEFFRIHRSFIVSLKHISSFTSHSVNLGVIEIPIGKNYNSAIFTALNYPNFNQPDHD